MNNEQTVEDLRGDNQRLRSMLRESNAREAEAQALLAKGQLEALAAEQQAEDAYQQLALARTSLSWRVTAPLRAIKRFLRP